MPRLRLEAELRDIKKILKSQGKFNLNHCPAARPTDISQALIDFNPNIVHFAGHGLDTGELCFENSFGNIQPIEPNLLADLFRLVADQTYCVFLNACYTKIQAEAIVKHISYVIGMTQNISDKAAIVFATGFYKAIGGGRSVEEAFEFGCAEIQLEGISEYQTPELLTRKTSIIFKEDQKTYQWELKLKGTYTNDNQHEVEAIVAKLREILGDASLTLKKVERGSIRLFLDGSKEEFEIFKELVELGILTEVLGIQIESVKSRYYNSFAWAAGYSDRWWSPTRDDFWPNGVIREETLKAYITAYQQYDYEICDSESFEEGFEKIAIYVDDNEKPQHAARQLSDGQWTSKLGSWERVTHEFAENFVIEIHGRMIDYGKIAVIMKRPKGDQNSDNEFDHT